MAECGRVWPSVVQGERDEPREVRSPNFFFRPRWEPVRRLLFSRSVSQSVGRLVRVRTQSISESNSRLVFSQAVSYDWSVIWFN